MFVRPCSREGGGRQPYERLRTTEGSADKDSVGQHATAQSCCLLMTGSDPSGGLACVACASGAHYEAARGGVCRQVEDRIRGRRGRPSSRDHPPLLSACLLVWQASHQSPNLAHRARSARSRRFLEPAQDFCSILYRSRKDEESKLLTMRPAPDGKKGK